MPAQNETRRRRLPAAERRTAIVAAAREVFIAQGFSGARTKEIADRSGVTEAFLYRHFESKSTMYDAAVLDPLRDGTRQLAEDVQRLHDEITDPIDFIQELNARCLAFYVDFAELQAVALYAEIGAGRDFYLKDLKPLLDRIGDLIADRVGWTGPSMNPTIVRQAILGAQWATGLAFALRQRREIGAGATRLTEMFTAGVKERPRSPQR
jgi:AcrR family transcriptional regulator